MKTKEVQLFIIRFSSGVLLSFYGSREAARELAERKAAEAKCSYEII